MSNRSLSVVWGIYLGGAVFVLGTSVVYVKYIGPGPDIESRPVFMHMPNSYESHVAKIPSVGIESDAVTVVTKCETDDCKVDRLYNKYTKRQVAELINRWDLNDDRPESKHSRKLISAVWERYTRESQLSEQDKLNAEIKEALGE